MELDIKSNDTNLIYNLLELLEKYYDKLPIELQNNLIEISKTGINDIDIDWIIDNFGADYNYESSLKDCRIISFNNILKRVKIFDKSVETIYPKHFWVKINDKKIVEW
jgi:hypothetical protein